jgi:ethanolamine utilization cobalamin adenosyltransferase
MLLNEQNVRENLRNKDGKRVFYLSKGDQLTSSARDYLNRERIEILPADQAKPSRYRLLGGGHLEEKSEHMTHLNAEVLVSKSHPRILFRGKLDTLEAELILCQLAADHLRVPVGEILAQVRQLIRCDVLEEPVPEQKLCGLTAEEIRRQSHFPQEYYGQPHFMPEASDGMIMARLNRARCTAREAELAAVTAFRDRERNPNRVDILQALNRMSSMLYLLMIQEKSKK